jgi:crossover junction endodeoxyribonuclease RuvC
MILGIDPGLSGGYAMILDGEVVAARPMPVEGGLIQIGTIAAILGAVERRKLVIIEKVHSMPGQGVASMFKFGTGFGQLIGMCQALNVPFQLVTPQAWKAKVLAGTTKDKEAAIAFVRSRYPTVSIVPPGCRVPHDGVADAVCLAHYGVMP